MSTHLESGSVTRTVSDHAADLTVAGVADYVVNVSSPNTPGLRDLQATERLRPVLVAVREALDASATGRRVPLLVKIAPDLADADVDAVAELALELGLDGIIATNTTISRDGLASPSREMAAAGPGGLSGPPLRDRALAVLVRLRARAGDRLVLIAAGGIETRTTPGPGCGPGPRWCRHAAGWARLTPRSRQSGETARPGRTGKGNRYLRGGLGQAAMTAARTDTRLGAMYRRIARKRGKQKAIVATQRTVKAFAVVSVTWNDRSQTAIIRA